MAHITQLNREVIAPISKIIAMGVRNNIEGFHGEHLTNAQMKELNLLIRDAIYTVILAMNRYNDNDKKLLAYLSEMIPDYWEEPKEVSL